VSEAADSGGCAAVAAGAFIGAVVGFIASIFVADVFRDADLFRDGQLSHPLFMPFANLVGCLIGAFGGALATAMYYDTQAKKQSPPIT
jgi:hypothetical protein